MPRSRLKGGAAAQGRTNGHSTEAPPPALIRLDIGCGQTKPEGWVGLDRAAIPGVDVVHDFNRHPWPFADASVEEARASHVVEHIPVPCACCPPQPDPLFQFFDDLHRVLVPGGRATVISPWHASVRAWQDPTHRRAISDATFLYLNRGWREANGLGHYEVACDFDFVPAYTLDGSTGVLQWNEERRAFAMRHHVNIVSDVVVTLVKHEAGCGRAQTGACSCAAQARLANAG